jgi:hypothetical protein
MEESRGGCLRQDEVFYSISVNMWWTWPFRSFFFRIVIHELVNTYWRLAALDALPSPAWQAGKLACGGERSRADDDCPAQRQRPLFFFAGVHCIPWLALSYTFIPNYAA